MRTVTAIDGTLAAVQPDAMVKVPVFVTTIFVTVSDMAIVVIILDKEIVNPPADRTYMFVIVKSVQLVP